MRRVVGLAGVVAVVTATLVIATASPSFAITCDKTWTDPGVDGVWEDPNTVDFLETQWTPAGPPAFGDSVCLPGGSYTVSMVAVPNVVEDLQIGDELGGAQPTLLIRGQSAGQGLTLAIAGSSGAENFGTLRLGHPSLLTNVAVTVGAEFLNHGTIDLVAGGGGGRTLDGSGLGVWTNLGTLHSAASAGALRCTTLTSTGTIDVDPGAALDDAGGGCGGVGVVLSNASVVNDGVFLASVSLSVQGSTALTGANPVSLVAGPLSITGSPTGKVRVGEATFAGTIPAGIEIVVDDFVPGSTGLLTTTAVTTNNGTVTLASADLAVNYLVSNATFTNNGTVNVAGFGGGLRPDSGISFVNTGLLHVTSDEGDYCGTVTNQGSGTIDIDAAARLWPHGFCTEDQLRLLGGILQNDGSVLADDALTVGGNADLDGTGATNPVLMNDGTLTFQPSSTAEGEVQVVNPATTLAAGTIPDDITVTIDNLGTFGATLTTTGAVTNKGTIRLASADADDLELSFADDTLTNNGTIELLQGGGGERRLRGNPNGTLHNNGLLHITSANGRNGCATTVNGNSGTIDVDPGAQWTTSCGSHTLTVNGGTVHVDGLLEASPVTIAGGRVSGSDGTIRGAVTNSGGTVAPGASVGTLVVDGTYTQTAGGRLEIETQTPGPGLGPADLLGVEDTATLGGTVVVDARAVTVPRALFVLSNDVITGTFAEVRGVPDDWVTYPFLNGATVESKVTFSDVPLTHPFFLDIAWAAGEGIVNGFPDGTFKPGNTATRQAVVAMLYRLAGTPNGADPSCSTKPFPDVPTSHPFCGEIDWAADQGLVNGFADGMFKPANTITRQALMAILYRMAGSPDGNDPTCSSTPFPDVTPSHPFCGEIEWAKGEGLANGFSDGNFKPANTLTRQAIAAFLHRFSDADLLADM